MRVLKFGGTSLGAADRIRAVVAIVRQRLEVGRALVVVSALGGVTDELLRLVEQARTGSAPYRSGLDALESRHRETLASVAPGEVDQGPGEAIGAAFDDLGDLLHGVSLLREASARTRDRVVSYGERLSAAIVAAALRDADVAAAAWDARPLVVTDDRFGAARVDVALTTARLRRRFGDGTGGRLAVLTGFIGATVDGQTTTLGRGGSDYTAALVGAALGAEAVEIWTDVDGVLSADPRVVARAFALPELSYDELMELSHFGAKVVYPPTVHPAPAEGIPLVIRNTMNPEAPGTTITPTVSRSHRPVRGISSIHRIALCRLEGDGMVGVPGIAARLFAALARRDVSIILISQASSEHSICFAVAPEAVTAARESVDEEFVLERRTGLVDDLVVEVDLSTLSLVGEGMRHTPGIAGRLFGELGRAGVNVRAIAQGSSELNISLVVAGEDERRALAAVHDRFFFPEERRLPVVVVGAGGVGGALLDQLARSRSRLLEEQGIRLSVIGVARSRTMFLEPEGLDLSSWRERLEIGGEPTDLGRVVDLVEAGSVLVDATASDAVPSRYEAALARGALVVTANKRALGGSWARYQALEPATRFADRRLVFETTVGAGLPVLGLLDSMVATGDRIERIEGVLSGTATFLANRLAAGVPFSASVREAFEQGLTEPDPRDDLSGHDVARKLLILARRAGRALEWEQVAVEPLLPGSDWLEGDLETFWRRLPEADERFRARAGEAEAAGRRLVYLATLDPEGARVGLSAVPSTHAAAGLSGGDNTILLWTDRYGERPVVVTGAGAGREVTAAGLFAGLLDAARRSWR